MFDKVRKLVGYLRFDTEKQVKLLNELYGVADIFENFFIPCVKLKAKIKDEKGKTTKKCMISQKHLIKEYWKAMNSQKKQKRNLMDTIMEELMKITHV